MVATNKDIIIRHLKIVITTCVVLLPALFLIWKTGVFSILLSSDESNIARLLEKYFDDNPPAVITSFNTLPIVNCMKSKDVEFNSVIPEIAKQVPYKIAIDDYDDMSYLMCKSLGLVNARDTLVDVDTCIYFWATDVGKQVLFLTNRFGQRSVAFRAAKGIKVSNIKKMSEENGLFEVMCIYRIIERASWLDSSLFKEKTDTLYARVHRSKKEWRLVTDLDLSYTYLSFMQKMVNSGNSAENE
jgi:hypothetical protein